MSGLQWGLRESTRDKIKWNTHTHEYMYTLLKSEQGLEIVPMSIFWVGIVLLRGFPGWRAFSAQTGEVLANRNKLVTIAPLNRT